MKRIDRMHLGYYILFIAIMTTVYSNMAIGKIIYVPLDYLTVQAGVDAVASGGIVRVSAFQLEWRQEMNENIELKFARNIGEDRDV